MNAFDHIADQATSCSMKGTIFLVIIWTFKRNDLTILIDLYRTIKLSCEFTFRPFYSNCMVFERNLHTFRNFYLLKSYTRHSMHLLYLRKLGLSPFLM